MGNETKCEKRAHEEQYSFYCPCKGGSFKSGVGNKPAIERLWHSWFKWHHEAECAPRRLR